MKFNWGTGIFLFLTLFLMAATVFIIFAFKQGVSLVHKDYYEKGADYTTQMQISQRSAVYYKSLNTYMEEDLFIIDFEESLAAKIDSGTALLFRPSDSDKDVKLSFDTFEKRLEISKQELISGRYILKIYWFSDGIKYEIDKPVSIQ